MNNDAIITDPTPSPQARLKRRRIPQPRAIILAGILLALAHPPASLFPLAWVALAPLLISVLEARRFREAFGRAYLFSLVFLGITCFWIGLTIVDYTHSTIGWIAWFALVPILSLYYGVWAGLTWWLSRPFPQGTRILIAAVTWTGMEYIRTFGTLTMPWAQLSYSQFLFLPLLQMVRVTGAYGLSFLLVLLNGGVGYAWWNRDDDQRYRWVMLYGFLLVMLTFIGYTRMQIPDPQEKIRVASMQGNFATVSSTELDLQALETITRLTIEASLPEGGHDLSVWAESAFPNGNLPQDSVWNRLFALSRLSGGAILGGSRLVDPLTRQDTNSALLFTSDGKMAHSEKQQHVPFGEFIPYRAYWPKSVSEGFGFFPSDLARGEGARLLNFRTQKGAEVRCGVFVCYESMYPVYARLMTHSGANLLVTISNDRWFQGRAAMEQHLSAVVLRAVENGRDVVRSTTSGISCLIDARGRIVKQAPMDQPTWIEGEATLREGQTLYARLGDWFPRLCLLGWAVLFYLDLRRKGTLQ